MTIHFSVVAGESHGQRSLVGYGSWSLKESERTEQLTHTRHTQIIGSEPRRIDVQVEKGFPKSHLSYWCLE